jgi:hypothetical protein
MAKNGQGMYRIDMYRKIPQRNDKALAGPVVTTMVIMVVMLAIGCRQVDPTTTPILATTIPLTTPTDSQSANISVTPLPTLTSTVEPALTPSSEWFEYENKVYGFSFLYPDGWTPVELPNRVTLVYQGLSIALNIWVKQSTEEVEIVRSGVSAGDLITRGTVAFLDQELSKNVLLYEGKDKAVLYNNAGEVQVNGLIFAISLESNRSDYDAIIIPEAIQTQADQILNSFTLQTESSFQEVALTSTPDVPATVIAYSPPSRHETYVAPNGKWQAELFIYDCIAVDTGFLIAYERLQIVTLNNGDQNEADRQMINCGGLGAYGLEGLFWSSNSRYFYYTIAREGAPDGCGFWLRPINRIDTESWAVEHLGGALFSPDETKLAAWQDKEMLVWNVDGGVIARIEAAIADVASGPMAWSPDSKALVYLQNLSYCPPEQSYGVYFDFVETEQKLLFESKVPSFISMIWEAPERLELSTPNGEKWEYSFVTEELRVVP